MSLIQRVYQQAIRPRVFDLSKDDAEKAHEWGIAQLLRLERNPVLASLTRSVLYYGNPMLSTRQFGISFPNPLGLAAGFDKYGEVYSRAIPATGWGFAEIGGFTPQKQEGNPRVRMRRSQELQAIWNFMGFNNLGAEGARLRMESKKRSSIPIGLNVGKGKDTPLQDAGKDYADVIKRLLKFVDFITINVSSPNTKALRDLQAKDLLELIIRTALIAEQTQAMYEDVFPLPAMGVKISPDESDEQLSDIADVIEKTEMNFLILTNTTVGRSGISGWDIPSDRGGVSGRPLTDRSRWVLKQMASRFPKDHRVRLISVGGIDSVKELYQRILIGASLCQVYTAWPFEGPDMCKRWLAELVVLLNQDGFRSVNEAIGASQ